MINKTTPSTSPDNHAAINAKLSAGAHMHENIEKGVLLSTYERREALHNRIKSLEFVEKIQEDIYFLKDRIAHIKRSRIASSNPTILKTYQSMLESRETVLKSIYGDQDEHYDTQNGASV